MVGAVVFFFILLLRLGITFAVNASPSIDKKVFIVIEGISPQCGGLGAFYFNVADSPYWREGTKFIKRFVGCPGDVLEVKGLEFYVNGHHIGTARTTDSKGIHVSHFEWNGKIPEGSYFVMGDDPRSYDSRYWGFVRKQWVIGRALPLF
jgi:signal peptidase I